MSRKMKLSGKTTKNTGRDIINSKKSYPEWSKLRNDLSMLHPLMLKKLQKTMCFIALDEGQQHVVTIVRVPLSEFPDTIKTVPMKLYIGLCLNDYADMFFFYPVIADEKSMWWTESWVYPYDDEIIDNVPYDPLSKEARKRLKLLLNQEYSYAIIVDENNKLRCTKKIPFTKFQRKIFPKFIKTLKEYEGKKISLDQSNNAMNEYLLKIGNEQINQQLELLLRERNVTNVICLGIEATLRAKKMNIL